MMKINNLCRVELYRFFHSISIIKYVIIVPFALFLMSYINIAHVENEITDNLVWGSIAADYTYLLAFICVIIAVYVGREFNQKTIYYEIMKGYSYCKIALSKMITCGVIISVAILMCLMMYLGMFSAALCGDYWLRILLLFVLFFHLCSSATLYVFLCRNTIIGGCAAFARFFVVEAVLQTITMHLVPNGEGNCFERLLAFNQWHELIRVDAPVTKELVISVVVATVIEFGLLQWVVDLKSKLSDM